MVLCKNVGKHRNTIPTKSVTGALHRNGDITPKSSSPFSSHLRDQKAIFCPGRLRAVDAMHIMYMGSRREIGSFKSKSTRLKVSYTTTYVHISFSRHVKAIPSAIAPVLEKVSNFGVDWQTNKLAASSSLGGFYHHLVRRMGNFSGMAIAFYSGKKSALRLFT